MENIIKIQIENGISYEAKVSESLDIKLGEYCVITRHDTLQEYGYVANKQKPITQETKIDELCVIERKATQEDRKKASENVVFARDAHQVALKAIEALKLDMNLLLTHYTFDKKLALFLFTADGRVDFRQLIKDLSQTLSIKIELRQIGVRDETAIIGGFGTCGQVLCCKRYLTHFDSMNLKMAKEQDLSLNPVNISGVCDRLKCCLKYEHEGYLELDKDMPRRGSCCECSEGTGKIIDRNLLAQTVKVQLDESGKCLTCHKKDVVVSYPNKQNLNINESSEDIEKKYKE